MMTHDTDLSELHEEFFQRLTDAVQRGVHSNDASEAMLTVGVSVLMREHGPRYTADRLRIVASMMTRLADRQEVGDSEASWH